ncbi:hypothetical protein DEU56DRAFT_901314 [Suillus clintonianus]|uniref:uncharacterized protein n=1 Tax=Suillus clintonianus TaxID=1904413 RepID=UPI001B864F0D|nr:uncharacterized protein DEU56DRAFT_901314 [Suillus clintonianus]KAG2138340.1 hypothetical protein DEU56DRAFT_901314 [Suillus clintonianus]
MCEVWLVCAQTGTRKSLVGRKVPGNLRTTSYSYRACPVAGAQNFSTTSHSYPIVIVHTSCPTHPVMKHHEMQPKSGFLSLAQELQLYILSFLPCRDILRCTSVCKALRQTYMSSSELQCIIELSGQRLLPVSSTDNHAPTSNRLQTLRDRAHAWFKFDMHSFESIDLPENLYAKKRVVTDGHLYLWDEGGDLAMITPILPKLSQRAIKRGWSPGTLCSVPHSNILDVLMDPAQNLMAIVYSVTDSDNPLQSDETVHIDLRALDDDSVHPQAAGRKLLLSVPAGYDDNHIETMYAKLKGCGRHIALQRMLVVAVDDGVTDHYAWQLQIWDWQNATTSSSVLSDMIQYPHENSIDFCFLGNNRLLVVVGDLQLYSIEDMSQTPQLLACFLSPLPLSALCFVPMDDVEQLQMQALQTMYNSDPTRRLLCLTVTCSTTLIFVISTRVFFDLDGIAVTMPVPWRRWGPSNTRIFRDPYHCETHVSGNRVLHAVGTPDTRPLEYEVRMMDFSPLAVMNRKGLGRVVNEPSMIEVVVLTSSTTQENRKITTSLPYVEVVSDRKISIHELEGIWLDKDRIYLLNANFQRGVAGSTEYLVSQSSRLEIIDV